MRTSARMAGAVAAIVAAALLVSGCGSSEDKGGKEDSGGGKPKATASESASPSKSGDEGGKGAEKGTGKGAESAPPTSDGKPAKLSGIWRAKTGSKEFVLTIAGDAVTLLRQEANCTGRVVEAGGKALTLKCPDGKGEERTNGKVAGLKPKSVKVTWNGGATDTFTKVAESPAKLPKDPKDVEKLIPVG